MITLVVSPDHLAQHEIEVDGPKYRHLFRARRLAEGTEIRLVDGKGAARSSRIVEVSRHRSRLELGETLPANEPDLALELLAPVPKASRLAWMVEKATEVGVHAIRLIQTKRAPRQRHSAALDRLARIAVAAVEQSHRSVVPEISGVHRWSEIEMLLAPATARWALNPTASTRSRQVSGDRSSLVVGPEGGFDQNEKEDLEKWGCQWIGLGPTVLRIETAAVVGSAGLLFP